MDVLNKMVGKRPGLIFSIFEHISQIQNHSFPSFAISIEITSALEKNQYINSPIKYIKEYFGRTMT